jgi:hypothetical protein
MAPYAALETDNIKDEARRDLLGLLEGVRYSAWRFVNITLIAG